MGLRKSYSIPLVFLAFAMGVGQQSSLVALGTDLGGLVGGLAGGIGLGAALNSVGSMANTLTNPVGGVLNSVVPNALNSMTKPVGGMLGALSGGAALPAMVSSVSGNARHPLAPVTGVMDGLMSGMSAMTGSGSLTDTVRSASDAAGGLTSGLIGGIIGGGRAGPAGGVAAAATAGAIAGARSASNLVRRESAIAGGMMAGALHGAPMTGFTGNMAMDAASAGLRMGMGAQSVASPRIAAAAANAAAGAAAGAAAAGAAAGAAASMGAASAVPEVMASQMATAAATENIVGGAIANQVAGRQVLAAEAASNARAEAEIAGSDMAAHGLNNARSASLASNAYRQAKLAGSRDRLNIAGTIQNSARISDAAIATHDSATKAEDSLLGSELAVDSAGTVLDSDAAYIPPVTNSLLRSLPYGRLSIRNIVPKPLSYPSVLLPDVWLNGNPVNYLSAPLRQLPYGISGANPLQLSGQLLANGVIMNGQPFLANNGLMLNSLAIEPAGNNLANSVYGIYGSSILPVLANGQLEAQDEIALANMVNNQQLNGAAMGATYNGFSRGNPVPMLTGSVTEANLSPTTTIGTTYPIGSALVIEPRDSYFQDYVDNASSRQNFDERSQ